MQCGWRARNSCIEKVAFSSGESQSCCISNRGRCLRRTRFLFVCLFVCLFCFVLFSTTFQGCEFEGQWSSRWWFCSCFLLCQLVGSEMILCCIEISKLFDILFRYVIQSSRLGCSFGSRQHGATAGGFYPLLSSHEMLHIVERQWIQINGVILWKFNFNKMNSMAIRTRPSMSIWVVGGKIVVLCGVC